MQVRFGIGELRQEFGGPKCWMYLIGVKEKSCWTCMQCTARLTRSQPIAQPTTNSSPKIRSLLPITLHFVELTTKCVLVYFKFESHQLSWWQKVMQCFLLVLPQCFIVVLQCFPPHPPSSSLWFLFIFIRPQHPLTWVQSGCSASFTTFRRQMWSQSALCVYSSL